METAVITDRFLDLIADREVLAALFTTYTFDPDFFELDVVPLLLSQDIAYSTDERVKRFMVREKLREAQLPIDVYYDLPVFRASSDCSPEMEYFCNGVDLRNCSFHGKVTMILLKNRPTKKETLLLGAGSNNLTRAGWWENIECQHWEEIESGAIAQDMLDILIDEIEFLKKRSEIAALDMNVAINHISDFVSNCKVSKEAKPIYYYGLSSQKNADSFLKFLRTQQSPLSSYENWTLEIISPFFADDAENEEHKIFFEMGVQEIKLFLPLDNEGNALCQRTYFNKIQNEQCIHWAQWQDRVKKLLGLVGNKFRGLHAKIYHFYNKRESWAFLGSVNFTYKALYKNAEAGFLVRLNRDKEFLAPYPDDSEIDNFAKPDESAPDEVSDEDLYAEIPEVHLCYDWKLKFLTGRTSPDYICNIEILGAEGDPVIDSWKLDDKKSKYAGSVGNLENLLGKSGSIVKVRGHCLRGEIKEIFQPHTLLLQQVGWSHKPLNYPDLNTAQILEIYAGMTSERRQMMLMDAKIRELVLNHQGGELSIQADYRNIDQFFCEYAEIFSAFRQLKKKLKQEFKSREYNQVDYYLTGTGADSLPTLTERTSNIEQENSLSIVTCYLVLLSVLEIYRTKTYEQRPNVKQEREKLLRRIKNHKKFGNLKLADNEQEYQERFFKWFEGEFFREYEVVRDQS